MKCKTQQVVVEVKFDVPVTEKQAAWKLKYMLNDDKAGLMFGPQIRKTQCKEFERVVRRCQAYKSLKAKLYS